MVYSQHRCHGRAQGSQTLRGTYDQIRLVLHIHIQRVLRRPLGEEAGLSFVRSHSLPITHIYTTALSICMCTFSVQPLSARHRSLRTWLTTAQALFSSSSLIPLCSCYVYNGSSAAWTAVRLIIAQFKPRTFSVPLPVLRRLLFSTPCMTPVCWVHNFVNK
jgi:hypothetical protein